MCACIVFFNLNYNYQKYYMYFVYSFSIQNSSPQQTIKINFKFAFYVFVSVLMTSTYSGRNNLYISTYSIKEILLIYMHHKTSFQSLKTKEIRKNLGAQKKGIEHMASLLIILLAHGLRTPWLSAN